MVKEIFAFSGLEPKEWLVNARRHSLVFEVEYNSWSDWTLVMHYGLIRQWSRVRRVGLAPAVSARRPRYTPGRSARGRASRALTSRNGAASPPASSSSTGPGRDSDFLRDRSYAIALSAISPAVVAALDPVGGLLGVREFPVGAAGLTSWACCRRRSRRARGSWRNSPGTRRRTGCSGC